MKTFVVAVSISATLLVAVLHLSTADDQEPTVGKACSSNSTCTGPNEYCLFYSDYLESPCKTGVCSCLPCYTDGDFTGLGSLGHLCAPWKRIQVGDACTGEYNEEIYTLHATCNLVENKLTCDDGYKQVGRDCIGGMLPAGSPCGYSNECAGDMRCDWDSKCNCYYDYEIYDSDLGMCRKRYYNDTCQTDAQCQVDGSMYYGYTKTYGVCVDGRCVCSNESSTETVGIIDPFSGEFLQMAICVNPVAAAMTGQTNGSCSLDPIRWDNWETTELCPSDSVCLRCADSEGSSFDGQCMKVKHRPAFDIDTCFPGSKNSTLARGKK